MPVTSFITSFTATVPRWPLPHTRGKQSACCPSHAQYFMSSPLQNARNSLLSSISNAQSHASVVEQHISNLLQFQQSCSTSLLSERSEDLTEASAALQGMWQYQFSTIPMNGALRAISNVSPLKLNCFQLVRGNGIVQVSFLFFYFSRKEVNWTCAYIFV